MHGLHDHREAGPRRPTAGVKRASTTSQGQPRSWTLLTLLSIAQFMVVLDATIVNVALPSIARSLAFRPDSLQWVVTAYVLASGGLVLLGGRAADVAGRRRLFYAGLALFTAASLASGLAPSAGALIAARAAQGTGAALLTPAALSIITTTYAGAQRARALGVWGALAGAGAAAGVLAGGMLTTWIGWRSVFLVNLPVGLAVGFLTPRRVPRSGAAARRERQLDLPGAALAIAGLVTLTYAIAEAPEHGWGSARTLLLIVAAIVLLAAFALTEARARRPLVPPATWRSRSLVAGVLVMFAATGVMVGTFFLNSLYLQEAQHASPLRVGLEFLPLALIIGAGAHVSARLLPHAGSRIVIAAGLASMGGGALLLSHVSAGPSYLTGLLPGLLVTGIGAGLTLPATAVTTLNDVADDRSGLASGVLSAAHEIGAALGVAVFSAIAVAVDGGIGAGYRHGFTVMAVIAAGLAVLAALAVPTVRPAAGTAVAVH
ncbi:MAG TPA: MFS transporter [Streptosporangiaceae bacterium]|nr:MFS transporter [Streptosporangiaceae bacterium]